MNVQVKPNIPLNTGKPSELRDYIAMIERDHPKEILRIKDEIDPAKFEATAILANLEEAGINPMVVFERPINQLGQVSPFPLVTNIYSSRRRDALALGLKANQDRIDLSGRFLDEMKSRVAQSAFQIGVKIRIDLQSNQSRIGAHSFQHLRRKSADARSVFDNDSRFVPINLLEHLVH